jgi:hypothetical protein
MQSVCVCVCERERESEKVIRGVRGTLCLPQYLALFASATLGTVKAHGRTNVRTYVFALHRSG